VAQDHNDIYSIVERLAILEGRITPATVKHGLNKQQKSVPQLPALFKPKDISPVLGSKKDPKHPMAGYMVGDSVENDKEPVEEDVLDKVKKSFAEYLSNVADEIKSDTDLKDKKKEDTDLKKKEKKDRDLIAKEADITTLETDSEQVEEDHRQLEVGDRIAVVAPNHYQGEFGEIVEFAPSGKFVVVKFDNGDEASMHLSDVEFHDDQEDEEDWDAGYDAYKEREWTESAPVKSITNECGLWEIHGNEPTGFEIRHGNNAMRSRFKTIEEAEMALEMFAARRRKADESADYIEEA
jgi:hypothetical protein